MSNIIYPGDKFWNPPTEPDVDNYMDDVKELEKEKSKVANSYKVGFREYTNDKYTFRVSKETMEIFFATKGSSEFKLIRGHSFTAEDINNFPEEIKRLYARQQQEREKNLY